MMTERSLCMISHSARWNQSNLLVFNVIDAIKENDRKLNMLHVVDTSEEKTDFNLVILCKNQVALQKEINRKGVTMDWTLKELSYAS